MFYSDIAQRVIAATGKRGTQAKENIMVLDNKRVAKNKRNQAAYLSG
jgi:hypothetical protein